MLGRCAAASTVVARSFVDAACLQRCELFNFSFAGLIRGNKEKGDRQLFDVKWHDEYANLGDDPKQTHKAMVDEDQRLRRSALFKAPLRRHVFNEIVAHRSKFKQVRS
jgi:hypothetical protein